MPKSTQVVTLHTMSHYSFLEIHSIKDGAVAIIKHDAFGEFVAKQIELELLAAAQEANFRLVVDLARVSLLTSSGVGALITVHKKCDQSAGRMVVCSVSDQINQVLQITKVSDILCITSDAKGAVEALQ